MINKLIHLQHFIFFSFIALIVVFFDDDSYARMVEVYGYPGVEIGMDLDSALKELSLREINRFDNKIVSKFEDNGLEFSATFTFNSDNMLTSVIESSDLSGQSFDEAYIQYNAIGKQFVSVYGSPKDVSLFASTAVDDKWCHEMWLFEGVVVGIGIDYLDKSKEFKISYLPNKQIDEHKLGVDENKITPTKNNIKNNKPEKNKSKFNYSPVDFIFAGIPWLSTIEFVREKMKDCGYEFVSERNIHIIPKFPPITEILYDGVVAGKSAEISILFDDQGLLFKVLITFTASKSYFDEYVHLGLDLEKKYGKPWTEIQKYEYPYRKGDGFRDTAIQLEKAHFATIWSKDANYLELSIDKNLSVILNYLTNDFSSYMDLRKVQTQKNL